MCTRASTTCLWPLLETHVRVRAAEGHPIDCRKSCTSLLFPTGYSRRDRQQAPQRGIITLLPLYSLLIREMLGHRCKQIIHQFDRPTNADVMYTIVCAVVSLSLSLQNSSMILRRGPDSRDCWLIRLSFGFADLVDRESH